MENFEYFATMPCDQALFMDMLDEPVVFLDGGLQIIYTNKAFSDKLGYPPEALMGMPFRQLLPDKDRLSVSNCLREMNLSEIKKIDLEHGLLLKTGDTCKCRTTAVLGTPAERQPSVMLRLRCVFDPAGDVSLELVRAMYAAMAEQTSEAFFMHDFSGRILDVNRRACEALGYTRDELLSMSVTEIEKSAGQVDLSSSWEKIKPGENYTLKGRHRRRDGTDFPVEISFGCVAFSGERYVLCLARDIFDAEQAEKRYRIIRERYELLFNKSAVPMLLTQLPSHKVAEVNDTWVDLFGYQRDEAIGKDPIELGVTKEFITDPDIVRSFEENKVVQNIELKLYTKDGRELTVINNICEIEFGGERFALISVQDITERKRAEAALFEVSELYRGIFENSALSTYLLGTDGQIINVNKAMCQVFGCTREELIGQSFSDISYPDDTELSINTINIMLSGECDTLAIQKRYLRKNGEIFWASVIGAIIRDIENKPLYFIVQLQDVTETRRLMEELRASEEFSRTIMDNLPIGVSVNSYRPPLLFDYINDKFPEFYRTTREALKGVDVFFDAVYEDPSFRETMRQRVLDDINSGDPTRMRWEYIPITRQGRETRYVTAYNVVVADKDMQISIVTDETEHVRAMEAVKKNAARLQMIHEFDLAILRGFESLYSIGENALRYIFELLEPDTAVIGILESDDDILQIVTSNKGQVTADRYQRSLHDQNYSRLFQITDMLTHRDGGELPPAILAELIDYPGAYRWTNIPILTAGRLRGVISIGYMPPGRLSGENIDALQEMATQVALAVEQSRLLRVTEQYATSLEQMIRERTAELEEANQELESFTFSVSHDLRAPLRSLNGFVRILLEDYGPILDDEGRRICDVIANSAQNMGQLIDDLLSLSRVGRSALEMTEVDMRAMAENVYTELTTEAQRAVIDFNISDLPAAQADHRLIRHVWVNLIENAIKFTSRCEKPCIKISAVTSSGETVYAVEDNGAGFNMAYSDKLFGVFQRLHSQKEFPGTGVGLAIVSRIVRRHGGRVWAYGRENLGATFYFSLRREDGGNG